MIVRIVVDGLDYDIRDLVDGLRRVAEEVIERGGRILDISLRYDADYGDTIVVFAEYPLPIN